MSSCRAVVFSDARILSHILDYITCPAPSIAIDSPSRKSAEEKVMDQFHARNQHLVHLKQVNVLRLVCKRWKYIVDNEEFVIVAEKEKIEKEKKSIFQRFVNFVLGDDDRPEIVNSRPFVHQSNQFWNPPSKELSNSTPKEIDRWRNIEFVDRMYESSLEKNDKRLNITPSRSVPSLNSLDDVKNSGSSDSELRSEWNLQERNTFWETIVIPKWEIVKNSPYTKMIWRKFGIPAHLRCQVWPLAIGNASNVKLEDYYRIYASIEAIETEKAKAHKRRESILNDTKRMFSTTDTSFPSFDNAFQKKLADLLEAFCYYRPNYSYIQGMSYLGAVLLNYVEPQEAFVCLVNLIERNDFSAYINMNLELIQKRLKVFNQIFEYNIPELYLYFRKSKLTPDLYMIGWYITLFCQQLEFSAVSTIWDGYLLDGEIFIYRSAVAILSFHRKKLIESNAIECQKIFHGSMYEISAETLSKLIQLVRVPPRLTHFFQ